MSLSVNLSRSPIRAPLTALIALAVALLAQPLMAITATRDGTTLVIRDGGNATRVQDHFDEHAFFVTIHAAAERGGKFYIVYGTSVFTRGFPPRSGHCGSGIETYIGWIEVSKEGEVLDAQRGLYESCSTNRHGGLIGWEGGKLRWLTTDLIEDKRHPDGSAVWQNISFTYDPAQPEAGISEKAEVEKANENSDTVANGSQ